MSEKLILGTDSLKDIDEADVKEFIYPDTNFKNYFVYIGRKEMQKALKKSKKRVGGSRRKEEDFVDDIFQADLAKKGIKGWSGLTPKVLKMFLPNINPVFLERVPADGLPYSPESARVLMIHSILYKEFFDSCQDDPEGWTEAEKEEAEEEADAEEKN